MPCRVLAIVRAGEAGAETAAGGSAHPAMTSVRPHRGEWSADTPSCWMSDDIPRCWLSGDTGRFDASRKADGGHEPDDTHCGKDGHRQGIGASRCCGYTGDKDRAANGGADA